LNLKFTLRFIGSSWFNSLNASMAFIQSKTGPLSSLEPLPYNFPSRSVKTNGSESQPSDKEAGWTSKCPYMRTVFLFGSLPSWPNTSGGSGMLEPSGRVCSPMSANSTWAPRSLSCFKDLTKNEMIIRSRIYNSIIYYISDDVATFYDVLTILGPSRDRRNGDKLLEPCNILGLIVVHVSLRIE
jgi:hypothetical protein